MRKFKGITAMAMAAVLSMGTLAGCGNTAETTSKENTKSEATSKSVSKEATEDEKVTLTVMTYFTQENPEAPAVAWKAMKEKFLDEHPNVTIEEEVIGTTDYLNKIKTLIATGDLPDVFLAGISVEDTYLNSGYAADLSEFVTGEYKAMFNEGALNDFTTEDGMIYSVPYALITNSNVIYNKEIFEKCGINEFPKTMDEFDTALQKIKDNGYIPISVGDKDNWYLDICMFREIADRYCGEDWAVGIDENSGAKFTDPEFIEALNHLKDWYDKGYFNEDLMSLNFLQHRQYYFDGEAAMYFDGSGGIPPIVSECPEEVLNVTEIASLPPIEGESVITGTANWGIAYNNKLEGAKKEAAQELIKTYCSPEGAKIVFESGGTAAIDVEYDGDKVVPVMQKYNKMMTEVKMHKMFTNAPSIANVMQPGLQDMLMGNISPEELAESLETEHQKLFE